MARTVAAAEKQIAKYNREREQIAALEDRLYELKKRNSATYTRMFDSLPEGYSILLPGGYSEDPAELRGPAVKESI